MIMKTWEKIKLQPALFQRYFIREKVFKGIRSYFEEKKFHEVETPLLVGSLPAESHLEIFQTSLLDRHRKSTPAYLLTSPEVPLKKLIVAGIGNCFSLTKSFRNMETQSALHNPEFTMLEWYHVGAEYEAIMSECEELVGYLAILLNKKLQVEYLGNKVDLTAPWDRLTIAESFQKYANINFNDFLDIQKATQITRTKGYSVEENTTWEEMFHQIFLNEIEPNLGKGKPTILYEFPSSMAALAKKKDADPRFSERFEFYIEGLELGDCYAELTDATEQEQRFIQETEKIKSSGNTVYHYDRDFIYALSQGMPKTSGIALGVDRLIMLFANTNDIADTMFFPSKDLFDLDYSDKL